MWKRINPKRRKGHSVRKSTASKEALDALDAFLADRDQKPIRFLCRFWGDQQDAITYRELRSIITDEEDPEKLFDDWFQDYSKLIQERITPLWEEAFKSSWRYHPQLKNLDITFELQSSDASVRSWITNRTAELVTAVTETQKDAVKYLIAEGKSAQMGSSELARYIRPAVGLTRQQSASNLRLYQTAKEQLRADHPRMSNESIERKARAIATRDAQRKQMRRAETIARTELAFAYNEGNDEMVRECISAGLLPKMKKVWCTGGGNICSVCEDLDGSAVEMDTEFSGKLGRRTYTALIPPIHPNCKCVVMYEETGEEVT